MVRDRAKSPSTAEFPNTEAFEGDDYVAGDLPAEFDDVEDLTVYVVTGDVDAQNGFGAMLRSRFNCRAVFSGGDFVGTELRFIESRG